MPRGERAGRRGSVEKEWRKEETEEELMDVGLAS